MQKTEDSGRRPRKTAPAAQSTAGAEKKKHPNATNTTVINDVSDCNNPAERLDPVPCSRGVPFPTFTSECSVSKASDTNVGSSSVAMTE